ncbi:hypothetical protein O3P69_001815 [Scylla paramamosain]
MENEPLPETREVLCQHLRAKVRYLHPALVDQITDALTATRSNKEIIDLLTSDTLLEDSLEKVIVSFTEQTPEVRESLGVALFQAVSQLEQELCAQVTGMLLELPVSSVTRLLSDRNLLMEAVKKSREEYLNFIQGKEGSTSTLSREKEEVGEVIYEKLVDTYPTEAPKLTGMLLQMEYKDLVRVIAEPDLFRKKVELALSVLRAGRDLPSPV